MADTLQNRLRDLRAALRDMETPASNRNPSFTPATPVPFTAPSPLSTAAGSSFLARPSASTPARAIQTGTSIRTGGDSGAEALLLRLMQDVHRKSGIAIGPALERNLRSVLANCNPVELTGWVNRLCAYEADHPEWLSLVEMLTVHETYFFRDPGQLDFLQKTALARIVEREASRIKPTLRIWSAASSSGEEVYTLAMLAVDSLHSVGAARLTAAGEVQIDPRWTVSVLGSDISRVVVQRARNAVYEDFGLGSFRGMPAKYRNYLEPYQAEDTIGSSGRYWRVRAGVRQLTQFRSFNLMHPEPPEREFDIVLCRNVMIYFDAETKERVCNMLYRALRPEGFLALGPTDNLTSSELFKPLWGPSTIIYQKR